MQHGMGTAQGECAFVVLLLPWRRASMPRPVHSVMPVIHSSRHACVFPVELMFCNQSLCAVGAVAEMTGRRGRVVADARNRGVFQLRAKPDSTEMDSLNVSEPGISALCDACTICMSQLWLQVCNQCHGLMHEHLHCAATFPAVDVLLKALQLSHSTCLHHLPHLPCNAAVLVNYLIRCTCNTGGFHHLPYIEPKASLPLLSCAFSC